MKLKDFDYFLPKNLIAQKPVKPRDSSRLLVLKRKDSQLEHKYFRELINYLRPDDLLVFNNSRVFPARLLGKKIPTGGRLEIFLLHNSGGYNWQCLLGGRGLHEGLAVEFGGRLKAVVEKNNQDGTWEVRFNKKEKPLKKIAEEIGLTPLPPYIKRQKIDQQDRERYQTIYASRQKVGSAAAPTAGLHFTPALLKKIKEKGVEVVFIALHVGLGTFAPVKTKEIKKHKMHPEWAEINKDAIYKIRRAKKDGRRIISVGTTTARALEAVGKNWPRPEKDFRGWINIFIYPGFKFRVIDGLVTNFHLPRSTLLMLVSALAGRQKILNSYREAVKREYRFYSYGDAMLIL